MICPAETPEVSGGGAESPLTLGFTPICRITTVNICLFGFTPIFRNLQKYHIMHSIVGSCSWVGEELGIDGVHQCRFPAQSNSGVLGGMEYGESGRDSTLGHCKVTVIPRSFPRSVVY